MATRTFELAGPKDGDLIFHIPPRTLPSRVHQEAHMAMWQVRGTTRVQCETQLVELVEGEVVWLPVGTRHGLELSSSSVLFPLIFPVAEVATLLHEITTVRIREEEKIYFLALFQDQSTIIGNVSNLSRQVLSILERDGLSQTDLPIPTTRPAAAVARALLFNPGDERRISEWAHEAHTSGRTIERAFVAETGMTFGEWRNRSRMHAAARLLESGSKVVSVTQRVGFGSPNSFARAFREFYGVSPTEYARWGSPSQHPVPLLAGQPVNDGS